MKPSSLESKTVRPGLGMYSFYHSDRHPMHSGQPVEVVKPKKTHKVRTLAAALVLLLGVSAFVFNNGDKQPVSSSSKAPAAVAVAEPMTASKVNQCSDNTLPKMVSIDISNRHLYACQGTKQVYDSPVITGMEKYAATLTPVGTYKIYAKAQDTVLTGSDETGAWRDPVSYWMPFLDNENGTYGFHDATWRNANEFGKVDPYGDKASHGCVELPLATSAWLYNWAEVGTTVTVQS